jgi:hypothetical protein
MRSTARSWINTYILYIFLYIGLDCDVYIIKLLQLLKYYNLIFVLIYDFFSLCVSGIDIFIYRNMRGSSFMTYVGTGSRPHTTRIPNYLIFRSYILYGIFYWVIPTLYLVLIFNMRRINMKFHMKNDMIRDWRYGA